MVGRGILVATGDKLGESEGNTEGKSVIVGSGDGVVVPLGSNSGDCEGIVVSFGVSEAKGGNSIPTISIACTFEFVKSKQYMLKNMNKYPRMSTLYTIQLSTTNCRSI